MILKIPQRRNTHPLTNVTDVSLISTATFLNIHSNYEKKNEEKPMGAVTAFTTGNYHCKPLMTDVTVIHMADVTVIHQVNM